MGGGGEPQEGVFKDMGEGGMKPTQEIRQRNGH